MFACHARPRARFSRDPARAEAESTFSAGFIRYQQHGSGATKGAALRYRIANAETFAVKWLHAHELLDGEVWRAAATEFVGTFFFCFVHIGLVFSALKMGMHSSVFAAVADGEGYEQPAVLTPEPLVPPLLLIALGTALLALMLIFAMSAASGGHFNPLITFSAAFTGLMKPTRAIIYLVVQMLGGWLGTVVVHITAGGDNDLLVGMTDLAGCGFGDATNTQAFLAEFIFSLFILWLAHSIAFDPQQFAVFGPVLAPIFLVTAFFLLIVAAGHIGPGIGLHIPRCVFPALISGNTKWIWVTLVANPAAAAVHAVFIYFVPPHHVVALYEAETKNEAGGGGGDGAAAEGDGVELTGTAGQADAEAAIPADDAKEE